MAKAVQTSISEPDETRENMKPSSMEPDDCRTFIYDIVSGMYGRVRHMDAERFKSPDNHPSPNTPSSERAKQFYGIECYQILSGVEAALDNWRRSGHAMREMKEKYGGKFVEGVEIGERLAVYEGTDFDFTVEKSDENSSDFSFTER